MESVAELWKFLPALQLRVPAYDRLNVQLTHPHAVNVVVESTAVLTAQGRVPDMQVEKSWVHRP